MLGDSFLLEPTDESIVFAVMANPEPDDIGAILNGCRSVMDADTGRPHPPDLFEVEGRMPGVILEQFVVCIGKRLNLLR